MDLVENSGNVGCISALKLAVYTVHCMHLSVYMECVYTICARVYDAVHDLLFIC